MKFLKKYKSYEMAYFIAMIFFMFYSTMVCFLLMGSFLVFKFVEHFIFLKYILKNGIRHVGEIVSYENDKGYKTPIIAFEAEGKYVKQEPKSYVSSDIDKFTSYKKNIGKPVAVLYDPKNPEKFIVADRRNSGSAGWLLVLLVGTVFIVISISSLLDYIKIRP